MPCVLFVHNGTPGRFEFIARALHRKGWTGALLNDQRGDDLPGMATMRWRLEREHPPSSYAVLRSVDAALVKASAAASAAQQLKETGFRPDVIIGHPAWGEMLFLDEVFEDVPQIQIGELYYRTRDLDTDFDPEFRRPGLERRMRVKAKNLVLAASHAQACRIVCPTQFQASTIPESFQPLIRVIHEGVDTTTTHRRTTASVQLPDGVTLDGSTPVVTFANRYFEPMRGFHSFMRALPDLLRLAPSAHVLMIGSEASGGYGPLPQPGRTWKDVLLEEVGERIDLSRVHFVGSLPREQFLDVLSISTAHVYLTYPFVLSWSLLDAMACECVVIGSDTAPVREVIRHKDNGLLVDFFDVEGLARTAAQVCNAPADRFAHLRATARTTVLERYDRTAHCEPAWLNLVEEVLEGRPAARA